MIYTKVATQVDQDQQITPQTYTDRFSENNEVYKIFFMIDPNRYVIERNKVPERIDRFFKYTTIILIVLNVILGTYTIYDRYIFDSTPIIYRDTSTILTNEI